MIETEKERSYRKTLENTRDKLDGFEEQYANKEVYSAFDELTGIVEKGLSQASKISVSTDNLSVEKLQEQLNTTKKALTEAIGDIEQLNGSDDTIKYYKQALATIGGDDEKSN